MLDCPGGFASRLREKVAADGGNRKSPAATADGAEAAEQKALEELGALVERRAEATKKLTGASLESMLAGMEVRGSRLPGRPAGRPAGPTIDVSPSRNEHARNGVHRQQ